MGKSSNQLGGMESGPYLGAHGELHIGVDEAGRGCLAGPVVAGAALFPLGFSFASMLPGLNDSKKLSPAQREGLAPLIREHALAWGVGIAWQDEIDTINILNATFRAMSRAVMALALQMSVTGSSCDSDILRSTLPGSAGSGETARPLLPVMLIDGNHTIPEAQWLAASTLVGSSLACPSFAAESMKSLRLVPEEGGELLAIRMPQQRAIVRGDSRCPSIAAASILAKTTRDQLMDSLEGIFPGYGFAGHKGYGTAAHLEALANNGPCALHRMTFRKVRPEEEQLSLL